MSAAGGSYGQDLSQHLRHHCGAGYHHTTNTGVVLERELAWWEKMKCACREAGKTQGPICRACSSSSESRAAGLLRSYSHLCSSSSQRLFLLSERAFRGTGAFDDSFPFKDCQMRLRGGREAGHPYHCQSKSHCFWEARCNHMQHSLLCGSSGLRQKGLCMVLPPLLTGRVAPH